MTSPNYDRRNNDETRAFRQPPAQAQPPQYRQQPYDSRYDNYPPERQQYPPQVPIKTNDPDKKPLFDYKGLGIETAIVTVVLTIVFGFIVGCLDNILARVTQDHPFTYIPMSGMSQYVTYAILFGVGYLAMTCLYVLLSNSVMSYKALFNTIIVIPIIWGVFIFLDNTNPWQSIPLAGILVAASITIWTVVPLRCDDHKNEKVAQARIEKHKNDS